MSAVITSLFGAGIRQVCKVLGLAEFDRFVASSYGTQCDQIAQMERLIGRFGEQQVKQLSDVNATQKQRIFDGAEQDCIKLAQQQIRRFWECM